MVEDAGDHEVDEIFDALRVVIEAGTRHCCTSESFLGTKLYLSKEETRLRVEAGLPHQGR